jgi:LysM repeat protein
MSMWRINRAAAAFALVAVLMSNLPASGQSAAPSDSSMGIDDFGPGVLGIYRKVMEIEDEIARHAERYGVDVDLARAVCMYESGGNANLTSWAGAEGYFQVMPATRRLLRVDTNIEAGIKYIGQLVERFEREDYALAAYNGGPSTVGRNRPMRLESLQYVLGVGHYRTLLKMHEDEIRRHAGSLLLYRAQEGDDWWTVAERLGLPLVQLRLHNPYIGHRTMRPGYLVAYPPEPRSGLFEAHDGYVAYISREGDNYFNVAFAFDVELDDLRQANQLWHLQTLPAGMRLEIPMHWEEDEHEVHRVASGQSVADVAEILEVSPWRVIRDNQLWDESIRAGMVLRVRPEPEEPEYLRHRVRSGDTLIGLANRYGTTVRTIQEVNQMGNRTMIRIGQELLIPSRATR